AASARTNSAASSSTMSWFGSSIGSAFSSLGAYSGGGGGGGGIAWSSSGVSPLNPGVSPKGAKEALIRTPPSAGLTPASPDSPASSSFLLIERQAESRPVSGGAAAVATADIAASPAHTPWASARAPPTTIVGDVGRQASAVHGSVSGGGSARGRAGAVWGEGRWSPIKHHHAARMGRDPTECPCGAAALYREVIEMGGQGVTMTAAAVVAGGEAVGAAEAAAELEAKAEAAHKMLRAKAFAHLLTRATKALAYARLQGAAFTFLRERGVAAKSEEAFVS
ncbi:unnamed protein product, partial [Hapterophycus canaliculatus]